MNRREGEPQSSLSRESMSTFGAVENLKLSEAKMELDRIAEESFSLLGRVLDESIELKSEENVRIAFVYHHARNIYQLGQDVIFLFEAGRFDSCPVIVRAMLESLFKLIAAVKQPDAAVQILTSEAEDADNQGQSR